MPPNSEIEKLERRWKENPKGTVFAPYAEVLRKHGDHELAREVLRQGLELHPDHIPGNIVLGRCCLDLSEDGSAEAAFTHVLELDAENVIALKALADITERQGRLLEGSHWLTRLISVDPSNDEAKDQLARVEAAREAAAAVITGQLTEQAGQAAPPVQESAAVAEVAAGDITADADSAVDRAMAAFDTPLPPTREVPSLRVPPGALARTAAEAETVPVMPVVRREPQSAAPEPLPELEPAELDLPRMSAGIEAPPLAGLQMDEPFAPPSPAAPPPGASDLLPAGNALGIGIEDHSEIELSPKGGSEFQSPDHSADLLSLSADSTEKSEFRVPDAAGELTVSPEEKSEFQSPNASEGLVGRVPPSPEPGEPAAVEAPAGWESPVYTSGYAAISMSPTEEFVTTPPSRPDSPEPSPPPAAGAVTLPPPPPVDQTPASLPVPAAVTETGSGRVEEPEPTTDQPVAVEAAAPLKLIFPDDVAEPEPPRRRVSEEALEAVTAADVPVPVVAPTPEPAVEGGEPELVVTESMAELYARQGHYAEAVNVYRVLLARQPRDARLAERLAEIEAAQQAGRRRMSFVAVDTGGESVESFFRSLAGARPGNPGAGAVSSAMSAQGEVSDQGGGGAPTRPTNDPLSLSAIFGEEPPPPSRGAPPAAEPPKRPPQDMFSFDQFFGATPAPGSGPDATPRLSGPRSEDLDQFQHWLKSLKR